MYRSVATLVEPDGTVDVLTFARATAGEAIAKAERQWAWLIDNRLIDLTITVYDPDGEPVLDLRLDDAQTYYDHRMYRIGRLDRSYLDLTIPIERRDDPRANDTCIIIGFRDNLDCTIHQRMASPSPAITSAYLKELWKLHESS